MAKNFSKNMQYIWCSKIYVINFGKFSLKRNGDTFFWKFGLYIAFFETTCDQIWPFLVFGSWQSWRLNVCVRREGKDLFCLRVVVATWLCVTKSKYVPCMSSQEVYFGKNFHYILGFLFFFFTFVKNTFFKIFWTLIDIQAALAIRGFSIRGFDYSQT